MPIEIKINEVSLEIDFNAVKYSMFHIKNSIKAKMISIVITKIIEIVNFWTIVIVFVDMHTRILLSDLHKR